MQLEQNILFSKIANEKSISRVAAQNHISQPALSQQMQRLEDEVGFKLFERSNRGIELTEAGKIMQKYAVQFMRVYENFREDIESLQNNSGIVRICATPVAGNYAIPCTLFKLKTQYPQYNFLLSSMPSSEVLHQVLDDEADIGFIVGSTGESGLVCKKSFSDKICLVAAEDYHVGEHISLRELQKFPLIMLNENFSSYRLLLEQIKTLGYDFGDFNIMCHLDSTESVKASVIARHGLAFLPYMAIKKEVYLKQLKILDADGINLSYDVYIIYKHKKQISNLGITEVTRYVEHIVSTSIC